ncbi:hypothetical protein [Solirhodobacter olei]|uniref:hypothetical protein n=1 Tax=Solirhodobacter olei TaxID=2493082 RepID=UPI000FDC5698|nr:hypothetical protein [Solirhodobacter olei]
MMNIVYHLGLHCTDEHRLETCLRQNAPALAAQGIVIPDPKVCGPILRNVVNAMQGAPSSPQTEETILDAVMIQDEAARLVFSNEAFLCVRAHVLGRGRLYPNAGGKVSALANLLPSCAAEMAFAIRNPATFLPALYQSGRWESFEAFLSGADPLALSWAEMVGRIRAERPDVPLTVWCDEDTPLIWPEVLRAVAGAAPGTALAGEGARLAGLMSPEGAARLADYLAARPAMPPAQRHRAVAAFLDKYALEGALEMELDLPGWTGALIEDLSRRYDADVEEIAAMEGVRLITPWPLAPAARPQPMPSAAL